MSNTYVCTIDLLNTTILVLRTFSHVDNFISINALRKSCHRTSGNMLEISMCNIIQRESLYFFERANIRNYPSDLKIFMYLIEERLH